MVISAKNVLNGARVFGVSWRHERSETSILLDGFCTGAARWQCWVEISCGAREGDIDTKLIRHPRTLCCGYPVSWLHLGLDFGQNLMSLLSALIHKKEL